MLVYRNLSLLVFFGVLSLCYVRPSSILVSEVPRPVLEEAKVRVCTEQREQPYRACAMCRTNCDTVFRTLGVHVRCITATSLVRTHGVIVVAFAESSPVA